MDKNAIKKYAVWARRELISRVSQRAALYEITDKDYGDASADSVLGRVMSAEEKHQRQALIAQIREKGYEQVMEEIAYTWFNRFIALRFMEVNGYLPSRVRVFTDDENNFKPQILTEAINMELNGLDMEKVYALKNANDDDALFKYMIIVQCNALSSILPGMFQHISDFTELLFPDNLLREGSVIEQMVSMIPEEDWTDQVQIIGWLYQYYNAEPKDKVFADLKKNIKVSKESLPAATQLFTPDWIVRYMVENSLGRLWLEGHPNDELKATWKYYLDEAKQAPEVQPQLTEVRKEYAALKPEDILAIDPCQGSGHILAYMFDVLVQIYESYGYTAREAAASIVKNNIWGLDIDDRASQLAYFSVMMKARQYDRRFFSRGILPHIYSIEESNGISSAPLHDMGIRLSQEEYGKAIKQIMKLLDEFHDAKEYGSIINVAEADWSLLRSFAVPRWESEGGQIPINIHGEVEAAPRLKALINLGQALSQKYHVVCTNPPYMANANMSVKLSAYVKKYYPDAKNDLYAVFIERCMAMVKTHGYQAMITQHSWMFLSRYEQLRLKIAARTMMNMAHLGARAFEEIGGEVVQTTAFVLSHCALHEYKSSYCRLVEPTTQAGKEELYLAKANIYVCSSDRFSVIPGRPVAYWVSDAVIRTFENYPSLNEVGLTRLGMTTGENAKFVRFWYEVEHALCVFNAKSQTDLDSRNGYWVPYNKGGGYRKWYGNNDCVLFWKDNGQAIRNFADDKGRIRSTVPNTEYYFLPCASWSKISTGKISFRFKEHSIFDVAGACYFASRYSLNYMMGFLNSCVVDTIISALSPTLNYEGGQIASLPVVFDKDKATKIEQLVSECISLSKSDWDSYETSWDFRHHPLLRKVSTIAEAFEQWKTECDDRFNQLKANEEELNRIFIDIYGLQDELTPEVEDKDVTVRKADLGRDIRSFISYAVGCMFGRYSLDVDGLAYAGGEWDNSKYASFAADKDNIIPICDDEYFEDDIVGLFVKFVKTVYGADTLDENLKFIADALGGKGAPKEAIRNYFLNDFYADHCKIYQKRPIYWLFDSGKKNGFKALIYMHRYREDTIARIRTDYVHEQQGRYRTAIADLESRIANADTGSRVKLTKQLTKLQNQAEELRVYEEKIHHLADQMIRIDLDDGVKHNYAIFQDVLAKIK